MKVPPSLSLPFSSWSFLFELFFAQAFLSASQVARQREGKASNAMQSINSNQIDQIKGKRYNLVFYSTKLSANEVVSN